MTLNLLQILLSQSKQSYLQNPVLIDFNPEQINYISSDEGQTQNDKNVLLKQNVIIHNYNLSSTENKTLKTQEITYNSELQLLKSPVETTLYQPQIQISGNRFEANLKTETYTFIDDVKTHYEPN